MEYDIRCRSARRTKESMQSYTPDATQASHPEKPKRLTFYNCGRLDINQLFVPIKIRTPNVLISHVVATYSPSAQSKIRDLRQRSQATPSENSETCRCRQIHVVEWSLPQQHIQKLVKIADLAIYSLIATDRKLTLIQKIFTD